MNFGEAFSLFGPQGAAVPGFAGGQFPTPQPVDFGMGGVNQALQQNALKPPPKSGGGFFRQGGTFSNILGALGDAMLAQAGRPGVYGPAQQRRKMGSALQNYLGNNDAALAEIMAADPEAGLALYKMKNPSKEPPSMVQEWLYRRGLPDDQRADYDKYVEARKFNPFAAPITLGPGDTYEGGGAPQGGAPAPQGEVTATGPNGEKVRFNPQSGQWEPLADGGPTAAPSGGFL